VHVHFPNSNEIDCRLNIVEDYKDSGLISLVNYLITLF
jgi:hypothetical protein